MKRPVFIAMISLTLLLGGCGVLDKFEKEGSNPRDAVAKDMDKYKEEYFIPVQDYVGDEYRLRDGDLENGKIAEGNREEVEKAVEDYFLTNYKTEVKVHNMVSAIDAVSVFVESIGEPHFYSYAIVPIDKKKREVKVDNVWSQEGEIEGAIRSGLYVMAFEEEFKKLDEHLKEIEEEYPVVGERIESKANTQGNGYNTEHYFVTSNFRPLYDMYLENPEISQEELRTFLNKGDYNYEKINGIPIRFYMEEADMQPTEELVNEMAEKIQKLDGIPGGRYLFILNDNFIDGPRASGEKDNTRRNVFHMEGEL